MSSPATIQRFINMTTSPIDLTRSTRSVSDVIIISSESEDEINDSPNNRNNNNYPFNGNNNQNDMFGFDNQDIFISSRLSSNNIQDSSGSNTNYNLRTNGSSPSTRSGRAQSRTSNPMGLGFLYNMISSNNNNNYINHRHHSSLFRPYPDTLFQSSDIRNNNSSGSSRPSIQTFPARTVRAARANASNDVQIIASPPSSRRRNDNSPKPTTLAGHARDLDESHILICARCDELLHEKLWALSNCGHVVCGSCVDKYKHSEKKKFPCPSCNKIVNPKNILQLYV